jgi:diacylglycerol kinase family enzyme
MGDLLLHGIRTVVRRHRGSKKVLYRRVKRLELTWEKPLPAQLDGDPYPESPTLVTVAPAALWVVVPKGFKSPLFSD